MDTVKMPSKRKRVLTESSYPRKVGHFTITNANPETMSVFDICKRMEELKEEPDNLYYMGAKSPNK